MKAKRIMCMIAASMAAGALIGVLYAPEEGKVTRKRLKSLSQKLGFYKDCDLETDRDTLEELRDELQMELNKINARLGA